MRKILLIGIIALVWPQFARADTWAIQGTLLTPDRIIDDGVVVVSDQRNSAVGTKAAFLKNAPFVKLHAVITTGVNRSARSPDLERLPTLTSVSEVCESLRVAGNA